MRKSLMPVLALLLACDTTEPVEAYVDLTGDYEGTFAALYNGRLEMRIRIDQLTDSYAGRGTVTGRLRIPSDSTVVTWDAEVEIRGAVAAGNEPQVTMDFNDGCGENSLSGEVSGISGFAIVLYGELLPADGDCVRPPRGTHVIGRLEQVDSED